MMILRTIDLFCGCGGMSLGFKNAGFELVAAIDNWKPAIETYRRNIPSHPVYNLDLSIMDGNEQIFHDINANVIIGGPPCQDFSSAGKRNESLGRADLTKIFATIIANQKPQWFIMENVERTLKSPIFAVSRQIFKQAGYGLTEYVLDASLCNVPQQRKRLFIIGELNGVDNALQPYLIKHLSHKPMTVRDYFGQTLDIEHYYRHPRSYARRGVFSIDEPSPTIRGVNRPIPPNYKSHNGDTTHPNPQLRPLTAQERAAIQTFPKDFIWIGNKSEIEQMIGNAVPVKLAEYVANCILEYCNQPTIEIIRPYQLALDL